MNLLTLGYFLKLLLLARRGLFLDTFFPEKSIQKPRPSKNSLDQSSFGLISGLLSRLFGFQINFFRKIQTYRDLDSD